MIIVALEEVGLPYRPPPADIGKGDQFAPGFLATNFTTGYSQNSLWTEKLFEAAQPCSSLSSDLRGVRPDR
jgi:hypothetical protein